MKFLLGLNDSFAQARGQILLNDSLPPINKVFSLILQEERHKSVGAQSGILTDNSNNLAFAVKSTPSKPTSSKNDANNRSKFRKKDGPYCTHCEIHGHTVETCYEIHGYPPGFQSKQKSRSANPPSRTPTSAASVNQISSQPPMETPTPRSNFFQTLSPEQYRQLMDMFSTHISSSMQHSDTQPGGTSSHSTGICFSVSLTPNISSGHYWIIDSGASSHICSHKDMFLALRPLSWAFVTLANNTVIPVHFHGDIQLSPQILLRNVLYLPHFKFNLLSVSALTTDSQVFVQFHHDHFIIQEIGTQKMIGKGDRTRELYVLDSHKPIADYSAYVNKVSTHTWHSRLGHPSFTVLEPLKKLLHLDSFKSFHDQPCHICSLAKQKRFSCRSQDQKHSASKGGIHKLTDILERVTKSEKNQK